MIAVREHEWRVEGSTGKIYTVSDYPERGFRCTCDGYYYRKRCRHIAEFVQLRKSIIETPKDQTVTEG